MCGITGFSIPVGIPPEQRQASFGPRLRAMTASLRHRGPDAQTGILLDGVALGHARLAIVDLSGGAQPMRDPRTGVTLVFNGEIFNFPELREELAGYPFRTRSDTEVILAAFQRWGIACLDRFNGQFAFALWDPRERALWLARDRVGILPLQYAESGGGIAFGSEAKALVAGGFVDGGLDARGLKQAITLWSPVAPRTCVAGVSALPAGHWARWSAGRIEVRRWWDVDLSGPPRELTEDAAVEEVGALLEDAVRLRLRADVPVAAYLSGGIDSSVLSAIAQARLGGTLRTFSVAFEDPAFDESAFQREVAAMLRTDHRSVVATAASIAQDLPAVVRHAEQVLVRTAPAPLWTLSGLVRESGGKVVLTGEGSDEILLGYDLYAETRVRQFWARRPASSARARLLGRLYPYLPIRSQGESVLKHVYGVGLDTPDHPAFSHLVRFTASARALRLLAPGFAAAIADEDPIDTLVASLPARVARWRPLARAQYLEMQTLLAGNLLAPQGDRMLMGHSVEGRFPFLDHRLIELAATLPDRCKLRGLAGKWVLKRYARGRVPASVLDRPKFPYRAPAVRQLLGDAAPAWSRELLSAPAVRQAGIFDPAKVGLLAAKLSRPGAVPSEADAMTVTAVATAQLLTRAFAGELSSPADRAAVALEVA